MSESTNGYERRDIRMSAPVWLGGTIVFLIALAALVCAWLFGFFDERVTEREVLRLPNRESEEPTIPADVIVQRRALERAAEEQLGTYGWIDAEKNKVHVPIERALEIVVESGQLPVFEGEEKN